MIIGIGSDLIDIRRIEKTLERFPEQFEIVAVGFLKLGVLMDDLVP